jgi:hypothetical protein
MATQGPLTWFDRNILKIGDGTLDLDTMAIKAALLSSSQAISRSFLGTSGEARYSDLTGELATANGYTSGGAALSSVALSRPTASRVRLTSSPVNWTLTGSITFKYVVLYVDGATNKELLMFADMDTGGGTVSALAGILQFTPDATNGWGYWEQP